MPSWVVDAPFNATVLSCSPTPGEGGKEGAAPASTKNVWLLLLLAGLQGELALVHYSCPAFQTANPCQACWMLLFLMLGSMRGSTHDAALAQLHRVPWRR